jgi:DNA replication protein DnaC
MKFYESHFEEYIIENKRENLHPKLEKLYSKFPKEINKLRNLIFYGPSGVGKYTQMLKAIKKYSPSELKYEKKT